MESPEELGYCDFCKEPFRKKKAEGQAPAPAPAVPVPSEVLAKVFPVKAIKPPSPPTEAPGIPPEFAHLDAGERIATPSAIVRYAAWGFLAIILLFGAVGMTWVLVKKRPVRPRHEKISRPAPAQPPPSTPWE